MLQTHDTTFITYNNLDNSFFSDYVAEFEYICQHINNYGNVPDSITFVNAFPDFDIVEVSESPQFILDELYKDKNKRSLAKTFNTVRKLLNENKVQDAMDLYTNAADMAVKAKHLDCVDIVRDTSRYERYVDRCNDFSKYYIHTGFNELDELIGGWDRNEELATIAARPGVGKSWVMLKCATAALEQGLNVGIYSGEMSEVKVGYRFDTLSGHISNYSITRGRAEVQNIYKQHIDSLSDKYTGCMKVITPAMINGPAGVSALRAFIEKEDIDILFVDQHSLLEDDRKSRVPVDRAANISRDLKNLQVMKKIPIIAVSQQNREKSDTGVGTANIAQSDRISQDSTFIMFLEQKDNIMTIDIVKSRDSESSKKLRYAINLDQGVFDYIPEESNALRGEGSEQLRQEFEEQISNEGDIF